VVKFPRTAKTLRGPNKAATKLSLGHLVVEIGGRRLRVCYVANDRDSKSDVGAVTVGILNY